MYSCIHSAFCAPGVTELPSLATLGEQILKLSIKVAPKAARNAINGWMGEVLKVSVTAVPERGRANQAVVELLAEALDLPKSAVSVVRGQTSAQKTVQIDGLADGEILRRLNHPCP